MIKRQEVFNKTNSWSLISLILVILFPVAYLYFRNLSLVNLGDFLVTTLLFFAIGIVFFAALWFLLRNSSKASIVASVAMLFIMMFRSIENGISAISPFFHYWHTIYLFLSLLVLIAIVLHLKVSTDLAGTITKTIAIVFGVLVLTNIVMAAPKIFTEVNKEDVQVEQANAIQSGTSSGENFYLLIFDEYGGYDGLLRYANFDNTAFYEELRSIGFNVSLHSRSNTISTNYEVPNLLNLTQSLSSKNYTRASRSAVMEDPLLFNLYKQNGYYIYVIDDQNFISPNPSSINQTFIPQGDLSRVETFLLVMMRSTIVYPFFTAKERDRTQEIDVMFDELGKAADIQETHLLTVSYMMLPHKPWVFDEDGRKINVSQRENYRDPNIYIGQLKYTSSKIIETVTGIIEKDPSAIIVILSDHGYRLPMQMEAFLDDEIKDRELESEYQRNILNAVYFKGEEFDTGNLSGLNTLIKVVNTHLSLGVPFNDVSD